MHLCSWIVSWSDFHLILGNFPLRIDEIINSTTLKAFQSPWRVMKEVRYAMENEPEKLEGNPAFIPVHRRPSPFSFSR